MLRSWKSSVGITMKSKVKKRLKITAIIIAALLVIIIGGFYIYTLDYYRADPIARRTIADQAESIQVQKNMTVLYPDEEMDLAAGLIFYPGGKVEAIAYVPLLELLAREGITCVLVEMPFNLAVFDVNAASKIYGQFPEIKEWYIGGHSLGGAMASSYVENNRAMLKGLILLGAYPINDADLPVLAIYGSEDIRLDKAKLANLPNVIRIAGGNHAQFGNYGEQRGDGTATITREAQQAQTVEAILEFIQSK